MNRQMLDPAAIAAQLPRGKVPPVDSWDPDFSGELDMQIARDGTWHYLGSPIKRQRMVKLFASILRCDEDGQYYLVTPVEKFAIRVEDAPFQAVAMDFHGTGRNQILTFRTNVDDQIMAGPDHPIRLDINPKTGEPSPYVHVRGRLEAMISRAVFYDLADLGIEESYDGECQFGVWSAGVFFSLGPQGSIM